MSIAKFYKHEVLTASKLNNALTDLETEMLALPDGSAVSAQVAINTTNIAQKGDIVELEDFQTVGAVLPQNGVYVCGGYPTHSVMGVSEVDDTDVNYIAFCILHEKASEYEPQNHTVLVYTKTDDGYTFKESFNTDTFEGQMQEDITRALGAYVATTEHPGMMSSADKASLAQKGNIVELTDYVSSGSILPKNGIYLYKGYPTHSVKGYTDDGMFYIAFCYEHESEGDYGPQNHSVIVYTRSGSDYVFQEKYNTEEADSSLEVTIAHALIACNATETNEGLMSAKDKTNLDKLVERMENIHTLLAEMLNKGVFTDKIETSLYGDTTSLCGISVCGKAICGTN